VRACALIFATLSMSLGAWGCTPRYEKNWHALRVGMDSQEVRELLGEPTAALPALTRATTRPSDRIMVALFLGDDFDRERWAYGPRGWFGSLANLFGPSRDAYVVYFDGARRVERWREPLDPREPDPRASPDHFFLAFARAACAEDGADEVFDLVAEGLARRDGRRAADVARRRLRGSGLRRPALAADKSRRAIRRSARRRPAVAARRRIGRLPVRVDDVPHAAHVDQAARQRGRARGDAVLARAQQRIAVVRVARRPVARRGGRCDRAVARLNAGARARRARPSSTGRPRSPAT
jgi:hypothetical protein